MIHLYIILARLKHGELWLPESSDEFIFIEKEDAMRAVTEMANNAISVVGLELHEFVSNKTLSIHPINR